MINTQIEEQETTEPESSDPQIPWVTVAILTLCSIGCIVVGIILCLVKTVFWTGIIACVIMAIFFALCAMNTVMCAGEHPYEDIA
jgi:uncharacterized membrane protein